VVVVVGATVVVVVGATVVVVVGATVVVVVGATVVVVVGATVVVVIGATVVVVVGATVVVVVGATVVVVVGATVVVVVVGGGGKKGGGGDPPVMTAGGEVTGGEVVATAVVVVVTTGGTGAGAKRTKNFPMAVALPAATSSKACDSATCFSLGESHSFSVKVPAEQLCDGSTGCFQPSATRWQVFASRVWPMTRVQPPLAGSSQGYALASRTAGWAGLAATTT
jgi:hypothetical protein